MASITPILGTDSLSSSRIVLNNNFESIRTELVGISSLLNVTGQTLQLTGGITSSTLSILSGATNLFLVNSTNVISGVAHIFKQNAIFEAGVIASVNGTSVLPVATLPTLNNWTKETYFVGPGAFVLSGAVEGQKVTLIAADIAGFSLNNAEIAGESVDIVITQDKTISLQYLGTSWYVISKN